MNYRQRHAYRQAMGVHPAQGLDLANNGRTCGECDHCAARQWGERTYYKCDLQRWSQGATTDIRKSWPACVRFTGSVAVEQPRRRRKDDDDWAPTMERITDGD